MNSTTTFPGTFDSSFEDRKHHPAAPEPASWGFITVAFAICVLVYVRFIRPRNRCACGHHHG